jgi:tRNA nucleotidyltransferase (CCA-adding enzyme)
LAGRIEDARRGAPEALGKQKDGPPSAIAAALRPLSIEGLLWLMALSEEGVKRTVSRFITEWRHVKPALQGGDLIDLGMSEGPLLGDALRSLRDARLDGVITSRSDEIARVQRLLGANKSR